MKKTAPQIQVKPDRILKRNMPPQQQAPSLRGIRSQVPTQKYKDNYDKIFGKK
jgi:hypothetical protein